MAVVPAPAVFAATGGKGRPCALSWLKVALIVAVVGVIYWPALHGAWLWDDNSEITTNLDLRGPLWNVWSAPASPDYFPLKATVQWFQWRAWHGDSTWGYHATNVLLHLASALLAWRLFAKLGLAWAWLGGLLFAVHPAAVESVAWIAELKNALALPPLLLAACAYVEFDRRGNRAGYLGALAWFLAALLCKSSVVMFPVMLLLHAWWKRGAIAGRDLARTFPFFALSLGLGLVTLWFQHSRAGWEIELGGPLSRLALAGSAAGFYLWKSAWPFGLMPVYPRWSIEPAPAWALLPWVGWIAGLVFAWTQRARWGRPALFALGCFLLGLLPVLGLVAISYFKVAWVADHFLHVSLVPVVGLLAAGIHAGWMHLSGMGRRVAMVGLVGTVGFLVVSARDYAGKFRGPGELWSHAWEKNPRSWLAANNLGVTWLDRGRPAEAIPFFETATRLDPREGPARVNWGNALAQLGREGEAATQFELALQLDPGSIEGHFNLANALARSGRGRDAVIHYELALRFAPSSVDAHVNLAHTLTELGDFPGAIAHFQAALQVQPGSLVARLGLGNLRAATGQLAEAVAEFQRATELEPSSMEARYSLADALAELGRPADAVRFYREAIALQPANPDLHLGLGHVLLTLNQGDEAAGEFQAALRLRPGDPDAQEGLRRFQAGTGAVR